MTTHILDFEEVLRNFEPYHVSLKSIQKEKKEFSQIPVLSPILKTKHIL